MKQLAVALTVLATFASEARAFDCPNTGDSCQVASGQEQFNFDLPLFGVFNDNVVLGQVDLVFGKTLAACVNGDLQFDAFKVRPTQVRDAVVCTGGGNDTVKVLAAGETFSCRFLGLPITMTSWRYSGYELAIYGQSGNDTITGADGRDQLCGGSGNDKLFGRLDINELNGGVGDDDLTGGPDIDYLFGADGDDVIVDTGTGGYRNACDDFSPTPSRIEGGNGNDCIQLPPASEPGWCYGQQEPCGPSFGNVCHAGLWCGAGSDRIDASSTNFGRDCEARTIGVACRR